jgi:hypothetical protein
MACIRLLDDGEANTEKCLLLLIMYSTVYSSNTERALFHLHSEAPSLSWLLRSSRQAV